jgi:cell division protein FtsI (penicillin-binding protein 3)
LRVGYLQFMPNKRLQALQDKQFQTTVTLQSRRGEILDRNGRELAMSSSSYSLYADPKILTDKRNLAKNLSKVLNQPSEAIFQKIKDKNKRFVWLGRQLEKAKADEIKEWNIRGLAFVEEWRRVYPNESLLSQTIGFLGADGQGLEGLELSLESELRGNQKKIIARRDARGRPLVADGLLFAENPDGNDVQLTIDSDLQYNLEYELAQTVSEFDADSAVGIILDPATSEILATATAPTFDANKAKSMNPEFRRNKVITDVFEPGSTIKTFLIAAALREKIISPKTKYYCENGSMKVGDRIIREADSKHKFGNMTVSEILAVSSNIGTTKIAFDLGAESLRKGLLDFGFGTKLGLDLPGEARGVLQALPWRQHLLANTSFGHGLSATPLQIANAYAAIANGGELKKPFILRSIRNQETGELKRTEPTVIRRVLTAEDAAKMRQMLLGVTSEGGTGMNANVDGYEVAGKTGTAQKVNIGGRGYLNGAYISSFGGFIPAKDPKFVIYVAVDNPKKIYYGSQVAAPLFSRLASYAVRRAGVTPQKVAIASAPNKKPLPQPSQSLAKQISKDETHKNLQKHQKNIIPFYTVPDLSNLTVREVIQRLEGQNLDVKFEGQGSVQMVIPSVGEALPEDRKLRVILKE